MCYVYYGEKNGLSVHFCKTHASWALLFTNAGAELAELGFQRDTHCMLGNAPNQKHTYLPMYNVKLLQNSVYLLMASAS